MESAILGLILDSSVIIDAERHGWNVTQLLEFVRGHFGEVDIAVSSVTIAELVHGVFRARSPQIRQRRRDFSDELKRHVPVLSVTAETAEMIGEISAQQAVTGTKIEFGDLAIGASALEQDFGVATFNTRHFLKIPGLIVKLPGELGKLLSV